MIYIIANELSGKGKGAESLKKVKEALNARGEEYITLISEYSGHSTELAKQACEENDCTLVMAIGGDGTFSEVLSGMDLSVPISFVPAGTGNDFAAGAEFSSDVEEAVSYALSGGVAEFDILDVNGRRCLNIAGTGFDVNVLLLEEKVRRFIRHKISYKIALFLSLVSLKFTEIELKVDEGEKRKLSVLLIAAANGKYYGGGMPISLDARCDDGFIDLVVIKKLPRIKIPYIFLRFFQGRLKEVTKYVEIHRCKKVEFSTTDRLPVNIDGELLTGDEITVEVMPKALRAACKIASLYEVECK